MKLQRFIGKNTKSVLDEIRATLGEDALIVSNTKIGSKTEIIAAREEVPQPTQAQSSEINSSSAPMSFGNFMEHPQVIHSDQRDDDPWQFLKNIQTEIQQIKSTISELPIGQARQEPHLELQNSANTKQVNEEGCVNRRLNSQTGVHILWGERRSGKTSLIKEVLSSESTDVRTINLVRLPHLYSFCDPHLAEIAAEHNVNLTYVNSQRQDWDVIITNKEEQLTIVEADLSMISNYQDRNNPLWSIADEHYSLVTDDDQSQLIFELFKNFGVETLTRL